MQISAEQTERLAKIASYRMPDRRDREIAAAMSPADDAWRHGLEAIKASSGKTALTKLARTYARKRRHHVRMANDNANFSRCGAAAKYDMHGHMADAYRDLGAEVQKRLAALAH